MKAGKPYAMCLFMIVFMVGVLQGSTLPCNEELASHEGLYAADPMVKICALPIDGDVDEVLAGISADVSRDTGIEEQYITYYWVPMTNVICMGEKTTDYPILVDLYVPGFFTNELIASMMTCLAAAIEEHVGIDREWVFIQAHFLTRARSTYPGKCRPGMITRVRKTLPSTPTSSNNWLPTRSRVKEQCRLIDIFCFRKDHPVMGVEAG